jgi:hypothetical protein
MKLISALIVLQFTGVVWGQQLASGHSDSHGVVVWYETKLEPADPPISKFGGGTLTENNIIKRHLCYFARKQYFGYDLTTEALGDGKYRLSFSPLSITPQKMEEIYPKEGSWSMVPLPQQPVTQVVQSGDTVAMDLFVNPSTGQKIVEYIKVQGSNAGGPLTVSGRSRDSSVEDGSLELDAPQLKINGVPSAESRGTVTGSPVWIYVMGRGRFVFTLAPRLDLGFQKAGQIRGSVMTWRFGNDEYVLSTNGRIAQGNGTFDLYVFNDVGFRLDSANGKLVMGTGGSLESMIRGQ